MLAPNVTAKFTAYKYKDYTVRVHIHTEDSSVWVVAKDVLKIMNKSNPSYYVHRLNKDREELSEESVDKLKDSVHIIKLIKEMCTL